MQFMADVTVKCADCDLPFRFLGLPAGVDLAGAAVSNNAEEARLALAPRGQVLSVLDGAPVGFSVKGEVGRGPEAIRIMILVDELRSDEGDAVELLCDNPEDGPNNAVVCCGEWTKWEPQRFFGDSLEEALQSAVTAKHGVTS